MAPLRRFLLASTFGLAACASADRSVPVREPAIVVDAASEDRLLALTIEADAREGMRRIEAFFGAPMPGDARIRVFPARAALDAYAREVWGMEATECWMVGVADEQGLILLSPRVWRDEACEHDPDDPDHLSDLVAHELVHVYHMQRNPAHEFDEVEGLDWFVEGLATLVSGQYERFHARRAAEAVERGAVPDRLADAWTGPYRYGVSGSLVAFVETRIGRGGLARLLDATSLDSALAAVGMSETELLRAWAEWVRSGAAISGGASGPTR